MKRHFTPGAMDCHGIARPFTGPRQHSCDEDCLRGCLWALRETEAGGAIPPRSWTPVRPAITVHRISRARRVRRFLRALFHFLTARKADLS